jgi:hypothetical protein
MLFSIKVTLINVHAAVKDLVRRANQENLINPSNEDNMSSISSILDYDLIEMVRELSALKSKQDRSFPIAKAVGKMT